jgi:hypothetical protein
MRGPARHGIGQGADMSEGQPVNANDDDSIVRTTTDRLIASLHQPRDAVEAAVRNELERRRADSRIQTFVPIFVERAARERLAS